MLACANAMPGHILRPAPNVPRVSADCPRVHEHGGAFGHVVPCDPACLLAFSWQKQWHHRMKPQRLLDDKLQVFQSGQVIFCYCSLPTEAATQLRLCLGHHSRVPCELGHGPLECIR